MLLPGAETQRMNQRQCLELLEGVEDTLHFLFATLTYLIHAESQRPLPDAELIASWEALQQEVFDVEYALPGADVTVYQQALRTYGKHNRELRPLVDQYMAK
ncbi:hypothetical protein H681_06435 [Pseudomonas sp. ATCC 13867]|uniref:hypothetical protein n=1 Tax=Pseudomonas sp. ATCC 13867 TaxID=1294143 RepID=UPI0002C4E917|nr:hypothetical protein [Pseudomonas sp. ATCC 13867]AGI23165.1 hypothetical protein H681_06435 [Pseudomonas sp. ATCC 13867]RFQ22363.1 hypothetical protein D0N87_23485 [Pseudomonas sp. ATCC 13867]